MAEFHSTDDAIKAKRVISDMKVKRRKFIITFGTRKGDAVNEVYNELYPSGKEDTVTATDCLYVINIPYDATKEKLQQRFPGSTAIRMPTDKETGVRKG